MKHIKLFEEYTSESAETGSYAPPKFLKRPAADDTGYNMVASYFGATKAPKKKKKNQRTQEVAEANVTDMLTDLIKNAKNSSVEKTDPSVEDLLNASPQIVVQNCGDTLKYFEYLIDDEKDILDDISKAAEAADLEIKKHEVIQNYKGKNMKVLVVELTNENA